MSKSLHPIARAIAKCFEPLERRQLMCCVHIDPVTIEFDPGTPETLVADHAVDTALHRPQRGRRRQPVQHRLDQSTSPKAA